MISSSGSPGTGLISLRRVRPQIDPARIVVAATDDDDDEMIALGYDPQTSFEAGVEKFVAWLEAQA